MTSHPPVILRRPHTRTPYTDDPDAIPYRGRFDHATDRTYLTDTPVLDELGRRNGMTHTWLEYRCAYVGCRYVLLVRAETAHDLALADHTRRTSPPLAGLIRPVQIDLGPITPSGALTRQIVQDAINTLDPRSLR